MRSGPTDTFDPVTVIAMMVAPPSGTESSNTLTFDCNDGRSVYFEHTLADSAQVQAFERIPVGFTVEALIDPNGDNLTFDPAAFQLPNNGDVAALEFDQEVLISVKIVSGPRQLLHVVGVNYGSGV